MPRGGGGGGGQAPMPAQADIALGGSKSALVPSKTRICPSHTERLLMTCSNQALDMAQPGLRHAQIRPQTWLALGLDSALGLGLRLVHRWQYCHVALSLSWVLGLGLELSARGVDERRIWHTCALVYLLIVSGCLSVCVGVACACAVGMVYGAFSGTLPVG